MHRTSTPNVDQMYNDFTVILPTLNEEDTIAGLISYLQRNYPKIRLCVVDDGSSDNTAKIVKNLSKSNKGLKLINRAVSGKKRGLTASLIDGIIASNTRFIITMDADLQHPPETIKKLAKALRSGCDLSVAVRARVKAWPLYRKIVSKSLIKLGYLVLVANGKSRCEDIFSGFFGVRRELFLSVYKNNSKRFVGSGYKILFDTLKCVDNDTIKIENIPYTFEARRFGNSKAGVWQGMLLLKSFFT